MAKEYYEATGKYANDMLTLDLVGALTDLYLAASYILTEKNELMLNQEDYDRVCEYLDENYTRMSNPARLAIDREDLANKKCSLTISTKSDGNWVVGKEYPAMVPSFIDDLENRLLDSEGILEVDFSTD